MSDSLAVMEEPSDYTCSGLQTSRTPAQMNFQDTTAGPEHSKEKAEGQKELSEPEDVLD
jgi:hypothetical protein